MRKERTLLILGLWVAALSYLGFPDSWKRILYLITGAMLVYLAYLFYFQARRRLPREKKESKTFTDSIVHNTHPHEPEV